LARRVVAELVESADHSLVAVGTVGERRLDSSVPWLGRRRTLATVIRRYAIRQVIIAHDAPATQDLIAAVWASASTRARVSVAHSLPDLVLPVGHPDRIGRLPLVHVRLGERRIMARLLRGIVDWAAAATLLVVTSPILAVACLATRLDSSGPAFFRQIRVGKDGRLFELVKLRTMTVDAEAKKWDLRPLNEADGPLFKLREDPRVTRAGRLLRRMSLDELPQLWNVLRGEMSLVGPRPATPDEVVRYPDAFRHRMRVRPGITGLWQITGRSELPFSEAMRMDLTYVDAWGPWLDVQILLRTIPAVLRGNGAY
jgi:exopolysaccharide biosynthesis polyprenyl glycosylphosphotransferase